MNSYQTINPTTDQPIQVWHYHSAGELEAILEKLTTGDWRDINSRRSILNRFAENLILKKEKLSQLMALEMGKPVTQAEAEVEKSALACRHYAENYHEHLSPRKLTNIRLSGRTLRRPLGPLLAIMPWNFPVWQVVRAFAPNFLVGNPFVLKHAPNVFGTASLIEQIARESGVTETAFASVILDIEATSQLIANPEIKTVTLTGSTEAGRKVAALAGQHLKPTVLELGGNDPYLVFADADLESAVKHCCVSRLLNNGQSCIAAKRFLVHENVIQDFLSRAIALFTQQVVGDPIDRNTTIGPLARHDLAQNIQKQLDVAFQNGAKQVWQAQRIPEGQCFVAPQIIEYPKGVRAIDQELFGPVATIQTFSSTEEAVALANETEYGLGAAVFTRDLQMANDLADNHLQAGSVAINDFVKSDPDFPFGGIKHSGYGRELGEDALFAFTNHKTIVVGKS